MPTMGMPAGSGGAYAAPMLPEESGAEGNPWPYMGKYT